MLISFYTDIQLIQIFQKRLKKLVYFYILRLQLENVLKKILG